MEPASMECTEARLLLHGYHDGELDLRSALELERHTAGCAACARELANHRALSGVLRAALPPSPAPGALAARLAASLHTRPPLPLGLRLRAALGPAAALATWVAMMVMIFTAPRGPSASSDDPLVRDVVADHVRALMPGHLADVTSTDRHTVKPWFAGKLDYAPPVEDLASDGFPLAGGRLDYLDGRAVAALVYRRRDHVVNVFVWPTAAPDAAPRELARTGHHVVHWVQQGMTFWTVSDLNEAELAQLAALLRARLTR